MAISGRCVREIASANAATHHGEPDQSLVADLDSNGWPQTGRNKALRAIRKAGAVHIGGDQHLPTVIQRMLQDPLAMRILEGDFPDGSKVSVDARVSGEALEFRKA